MQDQLVYTYLMDKTQKINAAYYDKNYLRWSERRVNSFFHEDRFRKFVTYFRRKDRILDIGCAFGIHVPLFLGIGSRLRYYGIDISKNMLKMAESRYPQLPFHYGNIADARTLPREKFDGFWAAAVLMHIPEKNWPMMLENIEKTMKKKAIGFMTLPIEKPGPLRKGDKRHFTLFPGKQLETLLVSRGWKIMERGALTGSNGQPWRWLIVKLP